MEKNSLDTQLLVVFLTAIGITCLLVAFILVVYRLRKRGPNLPPKGALRSHLARHIYIEKLVYRHHRKAGFALVVASALWLWLLSPLSAWQRFLEATWDYVLQVVLSGDRWILAGSCIAACTLVIGLLITIRPSLLRPFETRFNKPAPAKPRRRFADNQTTRH